MGYLQDQAVMNFAGSAARGSAIGTALQEGMASYLNDVDRLEVYNGAAWAPLAYGSAVTAAETRITSLEGTRPGTSGKPFNMSSGSLTTSASAQTIVTFPASRFSVTPNITASVIDNPNVSVAYIITPSSSSFSIGAFTIAGGRIAAVVHWYAIQMTSGAAGG
jgi:hypothetical protein